jgi:CheY-like chemotaxis protein
MILFSDMSRASTVHFGSDRPARRSPGSEVGDDQSADPQKLRVMIVEDELFVAMHLESVLEEIGFQIAAILSTGESAVKQFPLLRPDVVLMDINLGKGIDGITAAQQIRAAGDAQIVFVSAYNDTGTRARVEAAIPGSLLLSKPVTPDRLKSAIHAPRRH